MSSSRKLSSFCSCSSCCSPRWRKNGLRDKIVIEKQYQQEIDRREGGTNTSLLFLCASFRNSMSICLWAAWDSWWRQTSLLAWWKHSQGFIFMTQTCIQAHKLDFFFNYTMTEKGEKITFLGFLNIAQKKTKSSKSPNTSYEQIWIESKWNHASK